MKCSTCGGMNCMEHGGEIGSPGGPTSIKGKMDRKPLPKLKIGERGGPTSIKEKMAKGGEVDMYSMKPDVPAMHGYDEGGKVKAPAQTPEPPQSKNIKNNELDNAGGWSGAMKNLSKELGMADGGEVDEGHGDMDADDELNGMVADECFEAFEKKDKKAFMEAMKALVMGMGDK